MLEAILWRRLWHCELSWVVRRLQLWLRLSPQMELQAVKGQPLDFLCIRIAGLYIWHPQYCPSVKYKLIEGAKRHVLPIFSISLYEEHCPWHCTCNTHSFHLNYTRTGMTMQYFMSNRKTNKTMIGLGWNELLRIVDIKLKVLGHKILLHNREDFYRGKLESKLLNVKG